MSRVHDFTERLNWSEHLSGEAAWVEFYRRVWPDLLSAVALDKDSKWQRWGIDRVIFLPNGRQETVDEKKRDFRPRPFDDFLLEEWSDVGRQKPGWSVDGEKRCNWIAYAIPQLKKCYLLPFELLRITCQVNLEQWRRHSRPRYPIDVPNKGWVTRNCAVEWPRLFAAMREQMHRRFGANNLALPTPEQIQDMALFRWAGREAETSGRRDGDNDIPF